MRLVPGLYDLPLTNDLQDRIARLSAPVTSVVEPLDPADSNELLARHVANAVRTLLATIPEAERLQRQAEICNQLLAALERATGEDASSEILIAPAQRLTTVHSPNAFRPDPPAQPAIPLSQSDLLVNATGEPRVLSMLQSEIASADRIDLLIAFIRWSGLRLVEERLRHFVSRGGQLRVITTTYTGSTERRAIEHLVDLGATVKVSYHTDSTRLHAKAWLFHRDSGFSTAYIGSSNLSVSAMVDGLEWNVRLSEIDSPSIVDKFRAAFDTYWADPDFETYEKTESHRARFDQSVAGARNDPGMPIAIFDIQPWPHQRDILDRLHVERYRHNRWRNLVVAATGTGKTVVAALDYRRLIDDLQRPLRLLFVAHRREILSQSLLTFRTVMRDAAFGELYVDGHRPSEGDHVFASIQSLSNVALDQVASDHFDVVIVDEFHHAAASTYQRLLDHLAPKVLLGLTATPERTDGKPILDRFDGKFAVELRLWDALDRGLLSPFHYFGLHDGVDLSNAQWSAGGYQISDLDNLYTGNVARLNIVLTALQRKVSSLSAMRALGFCVSVAHARYMAEQFNKAGIPSAAVLGSTSSVERAAALRDLRSRKINMIFAVDVFNEGVDIPEVDTVLFLRPTESATLFLQQLGRGLRRSNDKSVLTVLDFIGNAHRNFRFDLRYRALTGGSKREVEEEIEAGFPTLPAGCAIQLDREVSEIVLRNLRETIGTTFKSLVAELRRLGSAISLGAFLAECRIEFEDLYRNDWSWTSLQRTAFSGENGVRTPEGDAEEALLLRSVARLLHTDDAARIDTIRGLIRQESMPVFDELTDADQRVVEGLLLTLFGRNEDIRQRAIERVWAAAAFRSELLQVLDLLDERAEHETRSLHTILPEHSWRDVPLSLHARYSLDEITAAIGRSTVERRVRLQSGVLWDPATKADYFFITLDKSGKHYSPTTRYRDYAISPSEFHWESQSSTREASPTGRRYVTHRDKGSRVFLFVRSARKLSDGRTMAYTFLGPADYVRHSGERPMSIVWRLHHHMPEDVFKTAKVAAG